jgi:hypothetical protein
VPSGLALTPVTAPSCPGSVAIVRPAATSQTFTSPSPPHVISREPPGPQQIPVTGPSWALMRVTVAQVAASQTLAVPSRPADASCFPSGL